MLKLSQIRTQAHLDGLSLPTVIASGCGFVSTICIDPFCAILTLFWGQAHPAAVHEESIPRIGCIYLHEH